MFRSSLIDLLVTHNKPLQGYPDIRLFVKCELRK